MKQFAITALTIVLALGTGAALAQQNMSDMKDMGMQKMDGMKGMDMGGEKATADARAKHRGLGVVKKLDAKSGSVTFDHEPVKSLNWPAMTMAFAVRDTTLLDKLTIGKKVEFEFVKDGREYVVTGVK